MLKTPFPPTRLAVAALFPFTAACGAGLAPAAEAAPDARGLLGNPAPDFSVKVLAHPSSPLSLRQLRGQVVVVDFWGTYCAPCKRELPKLQALSAKYSAAGLPLLGVHGNEAPDKEKIAAFLGSHRAQISL